MVNSTVLLDLTLGDLEGQNTYLMVLTLDFYFYSLDPILVSEYFKCVF